MRCKKLSISYYPMTTDNHACLGVTGQVNYLPHKLTVVLLNRYMLAIKLSTKSIYNRGFGAAKKCRSVKFNYCAECYRVLEITFCCRWLYLKLLKKDIKCVAS